jgi:N-acetylglucosamine-6-phosphate deacetylase
MKVLVQGASIFDGETLHENAALAIEETQVLGVQSRASPLDYDVVVDLDGGCIVPGFVDVQVNGGGGALLNASPNVDTIHRIATSHGAHGTCALLPTVITDAPDVIDAAIRAVTEAIREGVPGVIGIHIEGPFLDPVRKGAHDARFIRRMTDGDIASLIAADCGIKMLTVAPNMVSPQQISALVKHGIRVSLGHSEATAEEANAALNAGATAFTHLFNAMSQMTGRDPGMVGASLAHANSYIGLIADGHHVHPDALRVAIRAKGADRCMLISDAMPPAAGGPDGFELQGRKVVRQNGRLQLADGTLAGSNLTMDKAVRYVVKNLGIEINQAAKMASTTPAAFVGRAGNLGCLKAGSQASFVHLGTDLVVSRCWIYGHETVRPSGSRPV